eukprot:Phypoly_transcript_06093.p1 GENE.Phypoly_transcript_06093~~Phypoly_transcript_06093.p1  ORF type:complete len:403 (+),score=76.75 Phypoly_transcript_06093:319-1527(+)
MSAKSSIPHLNPEDVRKIVLKSFPTLKERDFQHKFRFLDGGIINLVYLVELTGDTPKDIPKKFVLKVIGDGWGGPKIQNEVTTMQFLNESISSLGLCTFSASVPGASPSYIPKIYSYESEISPLYIAMEYIEGETIKSIISSHEIPKERQQALLMQLANFYAALKSFSFSPPTYGLIGNFAAISLVNRETLQIDAKFIPDVETHVAPCSSFKEWIVGTLKFRIQEMKRLATEHPDLYHPFIPQFEKIVSQVENTDLLTDASWSASDKLTICHVDINSANVLVEPTTFELKAVIDWEWALSFTQEFETFDLDIDDSELMGHVLHFQGEISAQYPKAAFTHYGPEYELLPQVKTRKFWEGVTYFTMAFTCFHRWECGDLQKEKEKYAKEAVEILAEIEQHLASL